MKAKDLCGSPFQQNLLTALGAISNLYCLYKLDHPELRSVKMNGLASDPIATQTAILSEIRKALPGISMEAAPGILQTLENSLQNSFAKNSARSVRLSGFGVFDQTTPGAPQYELTLELPLSHFP